MFPSAIDAIAVCLENLMKENDFSKRGLSIKSFPALVSMIIETGCFSLDSLLMRGSRMYFKSVRMICRG